MGRVPDASLPPADFKGKQYLKGLQMDKGGDAAAAFYEYFQMDYEDIIGGDLPTRFKYRKVQHNDYGLTVDDILKKPDQELNRIMPLKKLRTYRDGSGVDMSGIVSNKTNEDNPKKKK